MWINLNNTLINLDHVARIQADGANVRLVLTTPDSDVTVQCATPAAANTLVTTLGLAVNATTEVGTVL
jgi:hypothetical protein